MPPQAPSAANTSTQTIGMLTSDVALVSDPSFKVAYYLELETNAIRRFGLVSIVSQFHVYLPWGQRPFSIVS